MLQTARSSCRVCIVQHERDIPEDEIGSLGRKMALIDAEEPPVHPTVNLEAHNDAARAHDMDVYHLPQWRAPAGSGLPCRIARQPQAGTGLPLVSQLSFFVGGLGLGSGPCYPLSLLLSEGGIGRPSGSLCHCCISLCFDKILQIIPMQGRGILWINSLLQERVTVASLTETYGSTGPLPGLNSLLQ